MRTRIFLSVCLFILLFFSQIALAQPYLIDTSSSDNATSNTSQRKTFFDAVNNTHWAFYYSGSQIEYAYSTDGELWTLLGSLPYNTPNFSLTYKNIAGTAYAFFAVEANTHDIVIRRGALTATTITFGSEITALNGTSQTNSFSKPNLILDQSNKLWVAALRDYGPELHDRYQAHAVRSINTADGDLSTYESIMVIGRKNPNLKDLVMIPETGSNISMVMNGEGTNVTAYRYNGTTWSINNAGGDYSWFNFNGSTIGLGVQAIAINGSDIYFGGEFTDAGGIVQADGIVRWDGTTWSTLGTGLSEDAKVYTIVVNGGDLYVAGSFSSAGGVAGTANIARWDGTSWHSIGDVVGGTIYSIAFDGTDLYIGGIFTNAGGNNDADNIAYWDGSAWNALGSGVNAFVRSVAIIGSDVYAGGGFTNAGGVAAADNIARWDGAAWNALGTSTDGDVYSLAKSGSILYVGGRFDSAGGVGNTKGIATWDGTTWGTLGSGLGGTAANVYGISVAGSNICIAGQFQNAGGNNDADNVACWDGAAWNALSVGASNTLLSIATSGSDVYVGGAFVDDLTGNIDYIGLWNGSAWSGFADFMKLAAIGGQVNAAVFYNGELYLGGTFTNAGGVAQADYIARWNGESWSALGSTPLVNYVHSLAVIGNDLYVGGDFISAGGVSGANTIARWNGTNWSALGSGLNAGVMAISQYGTDIVAGGFFTNAGGDPNADFIARFDGASWGAFGTGMDGPVRALEPSGSSLYAGGDFSLASGVVNTLRIARWDGTSWNALGSGISGVVYSIAASGTNVFVGGFFSSAGGVPNADGIARWDGSAWNALGTGIAGTVYDIQVLGDAAYVAGSFVNAGGGANNDYIAFFSQGAWNPIEKGLNNRVNTIATSGIQFVFGGQFTATADNTHDSKNLIQYTRAVIPNADTSSDISAIGDSSNNLHLLAVDNSSNIYYRQYDSDLSQWVDLVPLNATDAASRPGISYSPDTGKIYAVYRDGNSIFFRRAVSPYAAANWDSTATPIINLGPNTNPNVQADIASDRILVNWTSGFFAPFNVYSSLISIDQEMAVLGNSSTIADGDAAPDLFDHTDFATVSSASGTVTRTFTIQNLGEQNLILSGSPKVVISGANAADFTVTSTPATPLPEGQTTTFQITFDPSAVGVRTATVSIVNNDADENPYDFAIQGEGLLDTDEDGEPDVADLDDDNDGVTDTQEGIDGTDPLDGGSFLQVLGTTVCTDWNGFLDMFNIMEHVNLALSTRAFTTTIYNIGGVGQSSQNGAVLSGAQTDVLVHDMTGFIDSSYGRVCSTHDGSAGEVDGRMAYYRPNATGYDYAFTLPFNNPVQGKQYVLFNTYQPSLDSADASNFVANWVQVTNLESTTQTGTLYYYSQAGSVLATDTQTIPAGARRDFSGHQFGPTLVGMIEWRPNNNNAQFQMRSTRYFYDNATLAEGFDGAVPLDGMKGSGQALVVPLDTRSSTAVLEVGNATSSSQAIVVQFYSGAGALLGTQNLNLPAYGSVHLVADGIIINSLGSAKIDGAASQGVVATAMQYGRTASLGINYVYATPAKQALGLGLKGSYNTFLGQSCELEIVNASSSATTATVGMKRYDGTTVLSGQVINLAANGTAAYNACANDMSDVYGVVTVDAATNNTLSAHVIRKRPANDYRFSTPVRQ
ncbi:choice-of-anchor D domain-containing protein [bacterium]|nr:choice-of-anchor D domain-containing protein [bacterium]